MDQIFHWLIALAKCVVAGLVALILVFGVMFVANLTVAVMIGISGFGFEIAFDFRNPVFWLVSLAVFSAGFLWEHRRLAK